VILIPGCNLKRAAQRITWGKFHNNGMACVTPDHVYVHESIREQLAAEIKKYMVRILGEDPRQNITLPRMVNMAHYQRVMSMIDKEKVLAGGHGDPEELYIEPTLMDGVSPGDKVMQEEVFGPVLPLLSYENLESLLESLKRQPSPLMLYIFTGNVKLAKRILREVASGGGMINDVVLQFINMDSAFGGVGESGMGACHGKAGFDAFSQHKIIMHKPNWFELFLKYSPYGDMHLRLFRSVLGKSFRNFWR
jgi:aldehyde dehydrogenase (NAD+)